jgi:predicted DNA-binding helix-hairpin-helix protein
MIETPSKLEALVGGAQHDVCSYSAGGSPRRFIYHAAVPGKGTVPLFKVLLTNVCVNDCAYCANRVGRDSRRYSFRPEELAKVFMQMRDKRLVRGLFLSSGVAGNPARTQEAMVKVLEILRHQHGFDGYVHLKILPGAPFDCVEEGCRLADRVSLNMETPTADHMAKLSSRKDLHTDIVERMRWINRLMSSNDGLVPAGQTTQFVVGAAGESDRDILHTTGALYNEMELRRVYFSAFRPVPYSPLEGLNPASPRREHRLYQADWLLRVYGFSPQEVDLALGERGNLPLTKDPKMAIAQRQPWLFPVDVNKAGYEELLRVPGIGPLSARRIVEARKDHSIFSLEQMRKMRVATKRALPYIWFQGMLPSERQATFLPELDDELPPEAPSLASCLG